MIADGFTFSHTDRYSCICIGGDVDETDTRTWHNFGGYKILLDINCTYVRAIVRKILSSFKDEDDTGSRVTNRDLQIADFENIDWDPVMSNQSCASSYLVRKGLSRKAQLSLQIKRYNSKHPNSVLKTAVPFTIVLDTWNAFEVSYCYLS